MGAISFSLDAKLVEFLARQLSLRLFVETGAFQGDSLAVASRFISNCRSVEISPDLFEKVRVRFQDQPNIQVRLGDSPSFLRERYHEFAGQPSLFWLDAHWCQAEHAAEQPSQSPLLGELNALQLLHPDSVVLIDDARLYLATPVRPHHVGDWPDFHSVLTALLALSSVHRLMVFNDVIIFYPARIAEQMREFAYNNGVDWLILALHAKASQEPRPSPFVKFFRRLGRKLRPESPANAAH